MLTQARNTEFISKAVDKKQAIIKSVGNLDGITVMNNHILVGIYVRDEKTAGGIIRPSTNLTEDEFQGKCGLVLKKGPLAFIDQEFEGQDVTVGDWCIFRVNDGWHVRVNGTSCRLIQDAHIRLKLDSPELVV